MNQESIEQIVNAIKKMADNGNSYALIAQKLGKVSKATISDVLNGKHEKISQKMWWKLYNYLGFKKGYKIVSTSIFKQIDAALSNQKNRIIGICVPTGNGKTIAARHFCRNTDAIYMQVDATMSSSDLLSELAETFGTSGKSRREKLKNIVYFLIENETHLVLDEFSTAKVGVWETIFAIIKATEDACSFSLIGTPMMRSFIEKTARQKSGFAEINRRLNQNWISIDFSGYQKDVSAICIANNVEDKDLIKAALQLPNFGEVGDFIKNLLNSEAE